MSSAITSSDETIRHEATPSVPTVPPQQTSFNAFHHPFTTCATLMTLLKMRPQWVGTYTYDAQGNRLIEL
jgi:hypothetical protein